MITHLLATQSISSYAYDSFYQLFKKETYLVKSNIVLSIYGKNDPPALVFYFYQLQKKYTSLSSTIIPTSSASLIVFTIASSPTTALISISPFINKIIVLQFKA